MVKIVPARETVKKSEKIPVCSQCGSEQVVKNGSYSAINWLLLFIIHIFPFLAINPERKIGKLLCSSCRSSVMSKEQQVNTVIREAMKLLIAKLICVLRFSHGMSIRNISSVIAITFGSTYSTGFITTFCQRVAERAQKKMDQLATCTQYQAEMGILDETFPKTKESGTTRLGVVMDEFGLIRGVKAIIHRKHDLLSLLRSTMPTSVRYFLSDYDKTYPQIVKTVNPDIFLCKDFVHALRTIYRDARTVINRTKVKTRGRLSKQRQKEITQLKKKLLRKRLYQLLYRLSKGFKAEYAPVGTIYLEGVLEELRELALVFPSLEGFYEKTAKFIHKYLATWGVQMELYSEKGLPLTSNSIESKNSLFRVFSNISKCFENGTRMEEFFSAVALMENYNIRPRGKNKGSSALLRAGVVLEELGGTDFFTAIDLEEIVLGKNRLPKPASQIDAEEIDTYLQLLNKAA